MIQAVEVGLDLVVCRPGKGWELSSEGEVTHVVGAAVLLVIAVALSFVPMGVFVLDARNDEELLLALLGGGLAAALLFANSAWLTVVTFRAVFDRVPGLSRRLRPEDVRLREIVADAKAITDSEAWRSRRIDERRQVPRMMWRALRMNGDESVAAELRRMRSATERISLPTDPRRPPVA